MERESVKGFDPLESRSMVALTTADMRLGGELSPTVEWDRGAALSAHATCRTGEGG